MFWIVLVIQDEEFEVLTFFLLSTNVPSIFYWTIWLLGCSYQGKCCATMYWKTASFYLFWQVDKHKILLGLKLPIVPSEFIIINYFNFNYWRDHLWWGGRYTLDHICFEWFIQHQQSATRAPIVTLTGQRRSWVISTSLAVGPVAFDRLYWWATRASGHSPHNDVAPVLSAFYFVSGRCHFRFCIGHWRELRPLHSLSLAKLEWFLLCQWSTKLLSTISINLHRLRPSSSFGLVVLRWTLLRLRHMSWVEHGCHRLCYQSFRYAMNHTGVIQMIRLSSVFTWLLILITSWSEPRLDVNPEVS